MLLGVIVWALHAEYDRPWRKYQKQFRELEYNITAEEYQKLLLRKQEGLNDQKNNPPSSPFKKGGLIKSPPLVKGGEGGFFRAKKNREY